MKYLADILLVAILFSFTIELEAAYVITGRGRRIEGRDISINSNGEVTLYTAQGKIGFPKGAYRRAVADRPAALDLTKTLLKKGELAQAERTLQSAADKYEDLGWGTPIHLGLAAIKVRRDDFEGAIAEYEWVSQRDKKTFKKVEVQRKYRVALENAGQAGKLIDALNGAIKSAPRGEAARAYLNRGDVFLKRGLPEKALHDYLCVELFFRSQTALRAEAIYKTGRTFSELENDIAEEYFQLLESKYSNSEWAEKIKEGR